MKRITESHPVDTEQPALELMETGYVYPDHTVALSYIRLTVRHAEKVAVIGPNGAGKSTLLALLNGALPCRGSILVYGIPLKRNTMRFVKANVGLVFQNPDDQLFCPTIFEDVAFGPLNFGCNSREIKTRVSSALHEVGLDGYDERSSFHISFGERKLASIATVLSVNPRIIALDEPTSNLDPLHRRKIIRWIQSSPRTFIIATHDLDMALETCSRTVILNKGQIVSDGRTHELLKDHILLEANQLELPLMLQNHVQLPESEG